MNKNVADVRAALRPDELRLAAALLAFLSSQAGRLASDMGMIHLSTDGTVKVERLRGDAPVAYTVSVSCRRVAA